MSSFNFDPAIGLRRVVHTHSFYAMRLGVHLAAGTPGDYNQWKALGNEGWGYEDLEPYFVKSEKTHSLPGSKHRGKKGAC